MNKFRSLFLYACGISLFWVLSCDTSSTSSAPPAEAPPTENQQTEAVSSGPEEQARDSILAILQAYYADLAAEQIDESKYFAPTVRKFYRQENLPRETVGKSIRSGFEAVEDRKIVLDRASLQVQPEADGYVAEFEGAVSFVRSKDKSQVEERFRNRVRFNKQFQITSYEALEVQQPPSSPPQASQNEAARQLEMAQRDVITVNALFEALNTADAEKVMPFIHPELGLLYLTHPGAMDMVYVCENMAEVYNNKLTPYIREQLKQISCDLKLEPLPDFDCEKFSKEGCFMDKVENYTQITDLIHTLQEAEPGIIKAHELERAEKIQQLVSRKLVITDLALALYLGEIDNRWYLLVIDIASYDCSA